ncbi:MAG: hypothetical protein ACK5MT_21260 [Actinomycetales bacterium]
MSSFWANLFGRSPADTHAEREHAEREYRDPEQAPPGATTTGPGAAPAGEPITPHELEETLTELIRRVNREGERMPEGGVPAVREVEDVLRPLLAYLQQSPATEAEMIGVRAVITDYLPTTVETYLRLPRDFVATHRNASGNSPAEELIEQLDLLAAGAREYATAIYAGDAQLLTNQGRFLHSKFARSELDL